MSQTQNQVVTLCLNGAGGAEHAAFDPASDASPSGGGALWLHLNRDDDAVKTWITQHSNAPSDVVEAMLAETTRPRIEIMDEGVLFTLRGVNLNPDAELEELIAIRMWATPGRLVSVARYRFKSIDDVLAKLDENTGPATIGSLLAFIITGLSRRMETIVDEITEVIADIEDRVIDPRKFASRAELVDARLRTITLLRYLTPQHLAIEAFAVSPDAPLSDDDRDRLNSANQLLKRYVEDLVSARDRASVVQDEIANQAAEAMNARTYTLTLIAGLVLPVGAFTGLLGINVGGMPGADNPNAFWYVVGGLILMVGVSYVLVRRKKWL